ncbi:MAG: F0F1 ATP synthase subunit alpha, partial [Acidobacteria bacterium]|nr:F0F1 ATP synthase subunit alpha [Acidobacteriota bacterium]
QFEELETFARFGARLDETTRNVIEHGRRIRACLMQPEFAPVSVPTQITVLVALTAGLFDPVPIARMTEAESAVHEAAARIPEELRGRLEGDAVLSDDDRAAVLEIARQALAPFRQTPETQATATTPETAAGATTRRA